MADINLFSNFPDLVRKSSYLNDVGFWEWDIENNESILSPHFMAILGYSKEDLQYNFELLQKMIHPDDWAAFRENLQNHIDGKTSTYQSEHRKLHKNGTWVWIHSRGEVIARGEDGKATKMIGTNVDITKRKLYEEEYIKTQKLFVAIQEVKHALGHDVTYNEMLTIILKQFSIVTDSKRSYIRIKLKNEKEINELFLPESEPAINLDILSCGDEDELIQCYEDQKLVKIRLPFTDYLEGTIVLEIEDSNNRQLNVYLKTLITSAAQILQSKYMDQLRYETEDLMRLFLTHVSSAVAIFDTDMRYMFVSDSWLRDYHCPINNIIGMTHYEVFPDQPKHWRKIHQKCLQGESYIGPDEEVVTPDGEKIWISGEIRPWYKTDCTIGGVIMLTRVITERKKNELKLEKMIADLTRSNQDLERFAHICSHDLKEPIRSISSFIQLLLRRNEDQFDHSSKEYADYILKGIGRIEKLINDILVYSKIHLQRKKSCVRVQHVIVEIEEILMLHLKNCGGTMRFANMPEVQGDRSQILQLFRNLIENAIKFRSEDPLEINISFKSKGSFYEFTVADNGIGIEKEFRKKVFNMFERLNSKKEYEGSGLGLALCKKIVSSHGGVISIHDNPGKGCRFVFTLPKLGD
jgi:PAS domain S-box-containing protein